MYLYYNKNKMRYKGTRIVGKEIRIPPINRQTTK